MTVLMTLGDLAFASFLVAAVAFASWRLQLKMEGKIVLAALRATAQLMFLGYVLLVPIFESESSVLVLAYLSFVIIIASREGASRPQYNYGFGLLSAHAFVAIGGSATAVLGYTMVFVLHPSPWYEPQYLIPVAGMVIGNAISAFSLSADRFLNAMKHRRDEVELRLALGASRFEACLPLIQEAVVAGLTPSLNSMSVVGLVSIPGMMTGQILGGQPPGAAARYQLMILFVLVATVLATVAVCLALAVRTLVDAQHRLDLDAHSKTKTSGPWWVPARAPLVKRDGPRLDVLSASVGAFAATAAACWRRVAGDRTGFDRRGGAGARYVEIRSPMAAHVATEAGVVESAATAPKPAAAAAAALDASTHAVTWFSSRRSFAASTGGDPEAGRGGGGSSACRWALSVRRLTVVVPLPKPPSEITSADSFPGMRLLVRGLTVDVRPGEVLCVVGRSGVGKSRLLRAIAGLDHPHQHQHDEHQHQHQHQQHQQGGPVVALVADNDSPALVLGADEGLSGTGGGGRAVATPGRSERPAWRARVCFVPQDVPPLQGSPEGLLAEANAYAARCSRHAVRSTTADLHGIGSELGLGAGLLSRPWSDLSGGEKSRAALAVVLALEPPPEVVLLDEPTAALDDATTRLVEACVKRRCLGSTPRDGPGAQRQPQGLAVMWVTHDTAQAKRIADGVLQLNDANDAAP